MLFGTLLLFNILRSGKWAAFFLLCTRVCQHLRISWTCTDQGHDWWWGRQEVDQTTHAWLWATRCSENSFCTMAVELELFRSHCYSLYSWWSSFRVTELKVLHNEIFKRLLGMPSLHWSLPELSVLVANADTPCAVSMSCGAAPSGKHVEAREVIHRDWLKLYFHL